MSEEKPKCDIDDLMCQFQALNLLEGMEKLLGTEKFQERYPEFKGLDDVVREKITEQGLITKEMMERCGMPTEEFEKELGITETETTTEEE